MITIDNRPIYTGYIVIQNRDQFLTTVPRIHPNDPRYGIFWSKEFKKCIEGVWGEMFGRYRFCPGFLYYYANYFLLEDTDDNKQTRHIRPNIDDIEWEIAYMSLEAHGFSGWSKDEEYTSLELIKELRDQGITDPDSFIESRFPECIDLKGKLKKYIPARENIRKLHDKPLGKPIMKNETYNEDIMGTRGGGKSYITAGELEHGLIFDGATSYDKDFLSNRLVAQYCVGSGESDKSSELVSKVVASINAKADPLLGEQFGVWTEKIGDQTVVTPCPFFKDMKGDTAPPNKSNPYRYEYKIFQNGRWITKSGSKLNHVNYSPKKGNGSQAAAGGRYRKSVVEEVGLTPNAVEINTSNDSTTSRDGRRFGVERYMGTSGNIEYVQAAKKLFTNPFDYRIVAYKNEHGTEGQKGPDGNSYIGLFLPYYMVLRQYKDKDGNTNYTLAAKHVQKIRDQKAKSNDPTVLREHKMNHPCFVEEMWITPKGFLLPYEEAQLRERQLLSFEMYRTIETCVSLSWDSTSSRGVRYEILHDAEPYRDFPIDPVKRKNPQGCIVIYDFPKEINGVIPNDMYMFIGHDPYVEENIDKGGSIGSTYILMNPKYIPMGYPGNTVVASYIDKPLGGLDEYYENQEKLIAMYGNPIQGLCFEKNRGQDCRAFYIRKNKTQLLMPTPQHVQGTSIYQKNITSYGYNVGNKIAKLQLIKQLNDWLLEDTTLHDGTKKNIERIPCLYLIRQIMQYNLEENFDAVDGLRGCIVALKDYETRMLNDEAARKNSTSRKDYARILNNPRIFKNARYSKNQSGLN